MPGLRREGAFNPAMTTRGAQRTTRHNLQITERFYRLLKTCDQMAIMPTNSASDASAAASWITALNMVLSLERSENIVHVMFFCQAWRWPLSTSCRKQWFLLVPVIMPVSVLSFGRASEARPTKRPPALLRACRVFFRVRPETSALITEFSEHEAD